MDNETQVRLRPFGVDKGHPEGSGEGDMRKRNGVILAVIGYIVFFFCMEGWGGDWKVVF